MSTRDPGVHLRPLTRNRATLLPLTHGAGGLQDYKRVISASRRAAVSEPQTHEGYEWLYVLKSPPSFILSDQDLVL